MVSFRGRGQAAGFGRRAADGVLRRDCRPRGPKRGGGRVRAMPFGPEGRWQREGCPVTAALAAVKGLRRASTALGGGQDHRQEKKAPAVDGVIIHNPGLFGSLSRGMPSLRPPTTLASRLSAAGGSVPAAPKTREGFPVSGASESPSHGITWTLPLAPSPSPGAPRGAAPEPAALCLPSPWQVLAALAALPKEPANPLDWLCVGKVGQGQLL